MERNFCTACGSALAGGAAFCVNCGVAVSGPSPTLSSAQAAGSPLAPGYAPAAPPAYQPAPPSAYVPPPAPGAIGYAPPQPAKRSNVLRWVIIFIGIGMVLVGLARMTNGLGMITGGSRGAPAPTASDRADAERWASETMLVGTWAPSDSAGCAVWLRFNANLSLSDNAGNTGTWSIRPHNASSGTLTMTINNMPARSGELTRTGVDQFTLGGQSWRRTTC